MKLGTRFKAFLNPSQGKQTIFDPIGNVNASWMTLQDNQQFAEAYETTPELYSIITDEAKQTAKGIWMCENTKDKSLIEDDKLLDVLRNPNPIMSGAELLESSIIDWKVFGNFYNFFLTPLNKKPAPENIAAIYNMPAWHTRPVSTGKTFYQTKLEEIISKYVLQINGQSFDFTPDRILHISNNNINFLNGQNTIGQSQIKSLKYPISNIKAAYEARNVYITKRGMLGFISNDAGGDGAFSADFDTKEIQDSLKKYGVSRKQYQVAVTGAHAKWNPMSMPTKDLELYKEVRESAIALAKAYNYPSLLLGYPEGSTYSNLESETKRLYTDVVLPDAKHISDELNRSINSVEYNKRYFLDYSHIEALQKDKKTEAQRHAISVKMIIDLNTAIQSGNTSIEAAIMTLVNVAGMSNDEAKEVLSPRIKIESNETETTD